MSLSLADDDEGDVQGSQDEVDEDKKKGEEDEKADPAPDENESLALAKVEEPPIMEPPSTEPPAIEAPPIMEPPPGLPPQVAQSNSELLAGLADVLKQASAALARLGAPAPGADDGQSGQVNIAGAAAALAQVASALNVGEAPSSAIVPAEPPRGSSSAALASILGAKAAPERGGPVGSANPAPAPAAAVDDTPPAPGSLRDRILKAAANNAINGPPPVQQHHRGGKGGDRGAWSDGGRRPIGSGGSRRSRSRDAHPPDRRERERVHDYIQSHGLEPWVEEALLMLSSRQRRSVMQKELNVERARNPNGVMLSRIKEVAPVEQRIQMFIKVNELGEGVIDRLTTLTPEQLEATMDSGIKIQKATNPSGVAMTRITNVLKAMGDRRGPPGRSNAPPLARERSRSRERERRGRDRDGGRGGRSRSRERRGDRGHERREHSGERKREGGGRQGEETPEDVSRLVQELNLEPWCGDVLRRLTLWQRQKVVQEIGAMNRVRNPSGVVIGKVKQIVTPNELLGIFIDLNNLDKPVEDMLWDMTPDQRSEVIAPGIYVQNVRNPSVAVKSRIANVLEGRSAMNKPGGGPPPPREEGGDRTERGGDRKRRRGEDGKADDRGEKKDRKERHGHHRSGKRRKRRRDDGSSSSNSSGSGSDDDDASKSQQKERRRRN
eukprot:TRINITY_DN11968_c0_g1_i1.p1 TRINITY_DN11968_c0_g1~~TRINITY_DN11968_c0_g1_i1.p1  ORF type:complete len:666 (-),score=166.40 TRINITY_DN11968_c0_g1_i1:87-2084(-)